MFFESHAHYDDKRYDEDRDKILQGLQDQGVDTVINAGADIESSKSSIQLAKKYDFIYAAVGVHPHDVKNLKEGDIEVLRNLAKEEKVVAIGEIGLDYYYDNSPRELQKEWFKKQIKLSKELELPIIIHTRDAAQDTLDIVKRSQLSNKKGVVHCFSESLEMAREYIKLGFYIGVGGTVTFKNAKKLVEVVQNISMENILIETDCPYLSPVPKRGERNDSQKLIYVAQKIAEIKGISVEEIARITKENAKRLFQV